MTELSVGLGTQVTLHFAVKLADGDVVDSTFEGEPAQFIVGDGNLLEGFEQVLMGLTAGAHETFVIAPEDGFGQLNPQNIQVIERDQFDDAIELEEGLVLSFSDAQNAELPGVVTDFNEREVTIDFNHPLAGKKIHFEVQVIAVNPAVTH